MIPMPIPRLIRLLPMLSCLAAAPLAAANEPAPLRCEPSHVDSSIEGYGTIVSYRAGQKIVLANFTLTVLETGESPLFAAQGGDERVRLTTGGEPRSPIHFQVAGGHYVLELGHSVLFNRPIAADELVIWPRDEFQALQTRSSR